MTIAKTLTAKWVSDMYNSQKKKIEKQVQNSGYSWLVIKEM